MEEKKRKVKRKKRKKKRKGKEKEKKEKLRKKIKKIKRKKKCNVKEVFILFYAFKQTGKKIKIQISYLLYKGTNY